MITSVNNETKVMKNTKKILLTLTALTLLMLVAVLLNIPILREITSFVFLSFVPGFLILRILKFSKMNITDTLLLSLGLSFVLLMFVGLLINESYIFGVSRSLSAVPLTLGISSLTIILIVICYKLNLLNDFSLSLVNLKAKHSLFRYPILFLPIVLGIMGALFLNIPILLIMIFLIAIFFVISIFSRKLISQELYPVLIFSASLALLFSVVFTSKNIIGYDANLEYYVFRLTQINGHWTFLSPSLYSLETVNFASMLSITILPTIYQSMMNVSGEIVFKLIYPFIFSLIPVVLYRIIENQEDRLVSLVSPLFFISGVLVFYGITPISLDRQIVGMLFLTLSFFVLFKKEMPLNKKRLLLIVFGGALVVSHYSLMYIYLVLICSIYFFSKIKGDADRSLNGITVVLLFAITFFWYIFSVSPLISLNQFLSGLFSNFISDFLNPAARSTQTFTSQPISNIINSISLVIFFIANFLVALGALKIIFESKKNRFGSTFRKIVLLSATLLLLTFLLPNFAPSLNIDRFYSIILFFLAPGLVLGIDLLLDLIIGVWQKISNTNLSSNKTNQIRTALVCFILVSFFLTQTGFVNRITENAPILRSLDLDRVEKSNNTQLQINYYGAYLPEQDVTGAIWLHEYASSDSIVFADYLNINHVLTSYGLIPYQFSSPLSDTTVLSKGDFVYLGKLNIISGIINTYHGSINFSDFLLLLSQTDLIYSNGNTEVMYAVP
jgi:uncharacterized membrane protein